MPRRRPEGAERVHECTSRDKRWTPDLDDRYDYLARLVPDLGLA